MNQRRDQDRVYLALTIGTLLFVGGGIIAVVYGPAALLTALPFLLLGALLIAVLWIAASAITTWRQKQERAHHDDALRHIEAMEQKRRRDDADSPGG